MLLLSSYTAGIYRQYTHTRTRTHSQIYRIPHAATPRGIYTTTMSSGKQIKGIDGGEYICFHILCPSRVLQFVCMLSVSRFIS